jgi:hypothetical protein
MKSFRFVMSLLTALALALISFTPASAAGCPAPLGPVINGPFWTSSYSLELSAGYWTPGWHSYDFDLTDAGQTSFYHIDFYVTDAAPLHKGQVQLRGLGMRSVDDEVTEINPAQDTVMQVTFVYGNPDFTPGTREQAEAQRATLTVQVQLDSGGWIALPSGPLTKFCAVANPGRFMRSWGMNY